MSNNNILVGGALNGANQIAEQIFLLPKMATRHGLIAGATGTGKTVSLQLLAQNFSILGVPVFSADIKGDLSGISQTGVMKSGIQERITKLGITNFEPAACPVEVWDLFGETGLAIRTTISEMGPVLLARLLELNETQEGVLQIAFKIADDQGLLLLDLKDLKAMLQWIGENSKEVLTHYGNVSTTSIGALQRRLLVLEEAGGDKFFGEPALQLNHLIRKNSLGKGIVNLLDATKLINNPRIYSTFLLWLMRELFTELPEIGDQETPKMVFFFDEAHLLFDNTPKALLEEITKIVRLIRSRGVGIYFITQNPADLPDEILGQLGNRIQHALRAYTPKEQKAIKAASESFRKNPELDTETVLTSLGVGEALISMLNEKGEPEIVKKVLVAPPTSRIGAATSDEIKVITSNSELKSIYAENIDRESAYEILKIRATKSEQEKPDKANSRRQGPVEAFVKSVLRSIGSQVGRQIMRGVMGSMGSKR